MTWQRLGAGTDVLLDQDRRILGDVQPYRHGYFARVGQRALGEYGSRVAAQHAVEQACGGTVTP